MGNAQMNRLVAQNNSRLSSQNSSRVTSQNNSRVTSQNNSRNSPARKPTNTGIFVLEQQLFIPPHNSKNSRNQAVKSQRTQVCLSMNNSFILFRKNNSHVTRQNIS